ncbi:MAG: molybdenum cofactor guanylyltransferase [Methylococcales bacterium]|nr:molybdenum cofactor guanylyltransferase [Methylococcales bacterium]
MTVQKKEVTGVVLAGGLARRMNQQDKGLILYHNKPMVSYAVKVMANVANTVLINANRHKQAYEQFGHPVISDQTNTFDGPLAGILSAMMHSQTDILCVVPCDSPLIETQHLQKLISSLSDNHVDIAIAFDGERIQPVFLALKKSLQTSLENYLSEGKRKIDQWLFQHTHINVDFSQDPRIFLNINTLDDLISLENNTHE